MYRPFIFDGKYLQMIKDWGYSLYCKSMEIISFYNKMEHQHSYVQYNMF
jgi:hypothetical protein